MNYFKYETDEVISRVISTDFYFTFETNKYSVPWTLVGLAVSIKITTASIKIYYNKKYVEGHERSYLKNKVFTREKLMQEMKVI